MVKFTAEELRAIMANRPIIRKSTVTDSNVAAARIIAQESSGDVRMTDTCADEAERGNRIKSTVEPAVANLKRGGATWKAAVANLKRGSATWKDIVILVQGAIILVQALVIVILLSKLM